jgi:hypothetical protein
MKLQDKRSTTLSLVTQVLKTLVLPTFATFIDFLLFTNVKAMVQKTKTKAL